MLISHAIKYFFKIVLTLAITFIMVVPGNMMAIFLPSSPSHRIQPGSSAIRAVWVTPSSLYTKEKIDRTLERVTSGGFNTVFACVFFQGQTVYSSELATTHHNVEPEFNPLAYLVSEAHQRNIKVHAWFISGYLGQNRESPLLIEHPDWKLIGTDGGSYDWLNFNLPEVKQFFGNLAFEVVERYDVDGIHLDYIRYPDPEWGFDPYSMETFQQEYGLDANLLRYADLPAYAMFSGNPLTNPSTANVLVTFSNGYPAVTLNQYGEGEVILLNWEANKRNIALNSEILKRSLQRLLPPDGGVFLLRSETNAEKYGYEVLDQVMAWLEYLGWAGQEVGETDLVNLGPNSVLVLPGIYLITRETATQMADFVQRGGGMIIIDGPTRSIFLPEIQAITGMQSRGFHFKEQTIMTATGEHPLIPTSQREADLNQFQAWEAAWKDFRRKGVTLTVQEIHQRVQSTFPDVMVSTVIPGSADSAFQLRMQDWPTWLQTKSVDMLVPLAYVDKLEDLKPEIESWNQWIYGDIPFAFGLISYTGKGNAKTPKPPEQLITELWVLREAGIANFSIYNLDSLTDEQLAALAEDAQATNP